MELPAFAAMSLAFDYFESNDATGGSSLGLYSVAYVYGYDEGTAHFFANVQAGPTNTKYSSLDAS